MPNSFSINESTIYNYQFKEGEPKNIEYRISYGHVKIYSMHERNDIIVTSLTFINKEFLDKTKYYQDSSIFLEN